MGNDELNQRLESQPSDPGLRPDPERSLREQLLGRLVLGQTIAVSALTVMVLAGGLLMPRSDLLALMPIGAIAMAVGLVSYWLARRRRVEQASYLFLLGTSVAITSNVYIRGYQDESAIYYLWPILGAVALLDTRGSLLVSAVSTISYVALVVLQRLGYLTPLLPYDPQGQVLLSVGSRLLMFFLLAFLGWLSSQNLRRALQQARETAGRWQELNETLEQRVAERTREGEWRATQIATGAEISRIASQELDPDRLLRTVADLIGKRFQFYYVGIFIVDNEGRNAVLRAVTGPAGQTMLECGHQLEVGGTSMVGWVCANRKARIALDVGEEPVRFANPLLPFTRSEMALPLRVSDRVIGALDIQSTQAQAFDENDITALQGMADQIAVALENARLFQQAQSSLKELERANRLLTGQGWQEFLHARPADFAEFHQAGLAPLTPEETDRPASSKMDGAKRIHVPLRLRGEVVGSLVVERTPDQPAWSASECEMLEAAADQAAQTMDGVRLFEESQRLAAREQVIGTVTARMRESLDVDRVLQTAVREFAETLGVAEVKIRLMPDNQRPAVNG